MPFLILPDNTKVQVIGDKDPNQIIFEALGYSSSEMRKKIAGDIKINEVPLLNENSTIYLIKRPLAVISQEPALPQEEIMNKLKIVQKKFRRADYRDIKDYLSNADNLKRILTKHPILYNDSVGFNAICDFRFLVELILKNQNFISEHPHCGHIFKEVVEAQMAARKSTSQIHDEFDDEDAGPSLPNVRPNALNPVNATDSGPAITPQMLAQALHSSLIPNMPSLDLRHTYSSELAHLVEFGFTDEGANLEALQVCDGNVERALEYLVTRLEEMEQN